MQGEEVGELPPVLRATPQVDSMAVTHSTNHLVNLAMSTTNPTMPYTTHPQPLVGFVGLGPEAGGHRRKVWEAFTSNRGPDRWKGTRSPQLHPLTPTLTPTPSPLALESRKPASLACRQFACPQAVFEYEKKKKMSFWPHKTAGSLVIILQAGRLLACRQSGFSLQTV